MACAVSQRGIIGTNYMLDKTNSLTRIDNVTTAFEGYTVNSSQVVATADKCGSLDGSPEIYGGGGDTWYGITFNGSGGPTVTLTANQYVWAKSSGLGSYTLYRASQLTTAYYIAMIAWGSLTTVQFIQVHAVVSSGTPTADAYHPIFSTNNMYFVTEAADDTNFMAIAECAVA